MKWIVTLLCALVLSNTAYAQKVCGFTQRAVPEMGSDYQMISGAMCMNREAAIAVSRYWRDLISTSGESATLGQAIHFVNEKRGGQECDYHEDVIARRVAKTINTDQFDRKLVVNVWEVKADELTGTFITANYLEGCD